MYDLDLAVTGTLSAASATGVVAGSVVSVGTLNGDGTFTYREWRGIATATVKITGTFTATVQFEASVDGTNWDAILGVPKGGGTAVSSATATGTWFFPLAGYRYFRARCSAFTSAPTVLLAGFVASTPASGANGGSVPIVPQRGTLTETTPTLLNTTSTTLVAANTNRKFLMIQNDGATNLAVSMSGAAITGVVPTSTNIVMVLVPGASVSYENSFIPTGAVTGYQASGGTINTVYVAEG